MIDPAPEPGRRELTGPLRYRLFNTSFAYLFALVVFLIAVVVCEPWGNYPINDDWMYAHVARELAGSGRVAGDVFAQPNTIGQSLIAFPVIMLFGFSHVALRLLTVAMAACLMWAIHALLDYAEIETTVQALALLLLAVNPLFASLSLSFMTEIYGFAVAFFGAAVWFRGRLHYPGPPGGPFEQPLISWKACLLSPLAIGFSFWIRQVCVVVFPALVIATILTSGHARGLAALRHSAIRMSTSTAVFLMTVLSYFLWGAASGKLNNSAPSYHIVSYLLPPILRISVKVLLLCPPYMTLFFAPMLLWASWPRSSRRSLFCASLLLIAAGLACVVMVWVYAPSEDAVSDLIHSRFPFAGNYIYNAGLGPITLHDVYALKLPARPRWPGVIWQVLQWIIIAAQALWAPVVLRILPVMWNLKNRRRSEMMVFSLVFVIGSLLLIIQASLDNGTRDRYYLPVVIGLAIGISVVAAHDDWLHRTVGVARRWRLYSSLVAFLLLAAFTVAGLHDYFAWNDARWGLIEVARNQVKDDREIDGGFEVNGYVALAPSQEVRNARYRIGMNVFDGYEVVRSVKPHYWLTAGPPVILSRRPAAR